MHGPHLSAVSGEAVPMSQSIGAMVEQVSGMLGTRDLNDWEAGFVESIVERIGDVKDTSRLSSRQVEIVERIWRKHFAG